MHQVVEPKRQQSQQSVLQRKHRRCDEQLFEGREPKFTVQHSQHLFLCCDNIAHNAAIVEQAVVIPVFGVKIDLHRHHKIYACDENGQKRNKGRNIIVRSPIKQAFDLYAQRPRPADDKVGKQPDVGAQPRKGQRQERIHPAQKCPGALLALREVAVEQHYIPDHHQAVTHGHSKEHSLQHRTAQQHHQHEPQPERQRNGSQKRTEDATVVLDGGQVAHSIPVHDHLCKEPQAEQALQKGGPGNQQKQPIQCAAQYKHHAAGAPERRQDGLLLFLIQHICQIPCYRHGKEAGDRKGKQQRIGDHADQQILLIPRGTRPAAEQQNTKLKQNAQQHGAGADDTRIAVGPQGGKQPFAAEQLFQFKSNSCHGYSK